MKPKSHAVLSGIATLLICAGGCQRRAASPPPPADTCASNLKQIGIAILLYQQDHQQSFPPDLGALQVTEAIQTSVFFSPSTKYTLPEYATGREITAQQLDQLGAWVTANSDFGYVRPATNLPDANAVLCYEKGDYHGGDGTDILYGDGKVWRVPAAEARQQIDKARQAAAAAK